MIAIVISPLPQHMLFLGTEKYPKENEYHEFLSNHGGGANAYTSCEGLLTLFLLDASLLVSVVSYILF